MNWIKNGKVDISILGIRIRFELFKTFVNKILIRDDNGTLKRVFRAPKGVRIKFGGENSTIILAKGKYYKKVTMLIGNNSYVEIKKPHMWTLSNLFIEVNNTCSLNIEEGFNCVKGDILVCGNNNSIKIGKNCMFAKNFLIRTDDGHAIYDKDTLEPLNPPKDVIIGDRVWLGANTAILKGVTIENDTMVAADSLVTKSPEKSNVILAGVPAHIIKENICWDRRSYCDYKENINA